MRRGLLFRSGSLGRATDADLGELAALGIRTVIDLRTPLEQSRSPDRKLGEQYIHIPIKTSMVNEDGPLELMRSLLSGEIRRLDFAALAAQSYREMATIFRPEMSQVVRLAADPKNLPILIHCTAGKDRTGYACGLIQALIEVPRQVILWDYLRSNDLLGGYRGAMLRRLRIFTLFGAPRAKFLPVFEVRQAYLDAAFEQIERDFGTIQDYARTGLGLSEDVIRSLEGNLVDRG